MSLTLIDKTNPAAPACFGVCCPKHGQCARYEAVNGPHGANAIATCDDHNTGERRLFVAANANPSTRLA